MSYPIIAVCPPNTKDHPHVAKYTNDVHVNPGVIAESRFMRMLVEYQSQRYNWWYTADKQAADIGKSTELKTAQINSMVKEDTIKEAQSTKDLLIKDKQAARLDKEIALLDAQEDEMQESVTDRKQKRPVEVANLTKQGTLIDGQVSKLEEDKLYVIAQKTSMIEQVGHNKIIKAMDSMGDMIGTLGAGGLIPSSAMFGVYFRLNKLLSGENEPANYTVTKAV